MPITLIVTDVDNTLFDWVGAWHAAFTAMLGALVDVNGVSRERWYDAFRAAHRVQGVTGGINGLTAAARDVSGDRGEDALPTARAAFLREWQRHLVPYDGVAHTLEVLRDRGVRVVAITESDAATTAARVAALGLSPFIEAVYGSDAGAEAFREESELLRRTHPLSGIDVRYLPAALRKPDPAALRQVIADRGAAPQSTIVIGDNLFKDVCMAHGAGAIACWAEYGAQRVPEQAALLERVAHWTSDDVSGERATAPATVRPNYTLSRFGDVLRIVESPLRVRHRALER